MKGGLVITILLSLLAFDAAYAEVSQTEPPRGPVVTESQRVAPSEPVAPVELTAADLSAFLDGMLPSAMAIGDIAGATLAVVKDGSLLLTRAYGFADVDRQIKVSAEQTLFRLASISKLFTWTAVMQQVEARRLDLDADINTYLDFKIDGYGGAPIKLRHLMTHTAGFEETLRDLWVEDATDLRPLPEYLKSGIPARIYAPGTVPAYSNYGATLAGYIVSRVSGLSFDEYVEQHIFEPLGMSNSTFRQPVPESLASRVSVGYGRASEDGLPFEVIPDAPAGSLSATAPDMAQFMLAHLNDGSLPSGDAATRILQPTTVQLMHSVANRPAEHIDAMAYGFYEQNRNGRRVLAHGGDLTAFHSELILMEAENVGLFVSFNSSGADNSVYKVRTALYEAFMDRYFPRTERVSAAAQPAAEAKARSAAATGTYQLSRRAENNLFSVIYMFGQQAVTANDDGTLEIGGLNALNDQPKRFEEVAPWLWREQGGESRVAAVLDDRGLVQSLVPDGYGPIFVFQRAPLARSKAWLLPAMAGSALILATACIWWVIASIRRRRRHDVVSAGEVTGERRIHTLTMTGTLLCLLFAAIVGALTLMFSAGSFWILSSSSRPYVRMVQLIALLAALGAAASVVAAVWSWRTGSVRWRLSLGRTMVSAACVVWAYVAIAFHFLAIHLQY